MQRNRLEIFERQIVSDPSCFIIAEAGVNHNGSIELALQLIDEAFTAGADAVKFQTFNAVDLASVTAPKANYQLRSTEAEESQLEMLKRLQLSKKDHKRLIEYCQAKGIQFISSSFDIASADLLDSLEVPLFKIPSGEITNTPLLRHVARKGKPMIVSTGMSRLGEVEKAVNTIQSEGNEKVVLLHCVSSYPAEAKDVNLHSMQTLATAFQLPVGFSDHTQGIEVAIAAVALGACVIEKHFTIDRNLPGPDHMASLKPDELCKLVNAIRNVERALGQWQKVPAACELGTAEVARKSLVAASDIPEGAKLAEEDLSIQRPGTGLPPSLLEYMVGRTTQMEIPAGTLIKLEMLK
jgi:N-acetylneuraminate synthase